MTARRPLSPRPPAGGRRRTAVIRPGPRLLRHQPCLGGRRVGGNRGPEVGHRWPPTPRRRRRSAGAHSSSGPATRHASPSTMRAGSRYRDGSSRLTRRKPVGTVDPPPPTPPPDPPPGDRAWPGDAEEVNGVDPDGPRSSSVDPDEGDEVSSSEVGLVALDGVEAVGVVFPDEATGPVGGVVSVGLVDRGGRDVGGDVHQCRLVEAVGQRRVTGGEGGARVRVGDQVGEEVGHGRGHLRLLRAWWGPWRR